MADPDALARAPSGLVPPVGEHPTPPARRAGAVAWALALLMLALLAFLLWAAPRAEGGLSLTDPMVPGGWMAWTLATALFFWAVAALILLMLVLALRFPETPRVGVLRLETTRGDRLFISLLGSAFINLAWLGLVGQAQWGALIASLLFALATFRWA